MLPFNKNLLKQITREFGWKTQQMNLCSMCIRDRSLVLFYLRSLFKKIPFDGCPIEEVSLLYS